MNSPLSMSLNLACPHCQATVSVPSEQAGQVASCPQCAGRFQVPIPIAPPVIQPAFNTGTSNPASNIQSAGLATPEAREFVGRKIAAGILGILVGNLGIHKFLLGYPATGTIMLASTILGAITGACLVIPLLLPIAMQIIGFIEGILYLTKSDEEFYRTYGVGKREWF